MDGDLEMFIAIDEFLTGKRKSAWDHERLVWDRYVQKLLHEEHFHIRHRMPLKDFDAFVELLGDEIAPNIRQAKRRNEEPIYPEMVAAIGIRVFAGGNYDDIMNTYGVSKSGYCHSRNRFLKALLGTVVSG